MELMHVYESKVENAASGAEKMKDDPEDSAYSTHECESKEWNVDAKMVLVVQYR